MAKSKFQVGDRILYVNGKERESGTILRAYEYQSHLKNNDPAWWIKWDDTGLELWIEERELKHFTDIDDVLLEGVKLTKIQHQRFLAARQLFINLKREAIVNSAKILFDSTIIAPEQIKLVGDSIFVQIDNCRYMFFQADPNYDHGLFTKAAEFEKNVRSRFKLVKELAW